MIFCDNNVLAQSARVELCWNTVHRGLAGAANLSEACDSSAFHVRSVFWNICAVVLAAVAGAAKHSSPVYQSLATLSRPRTAQGDGRELVVKLRCQCESE